MNETYEVNGVLRWIINDAIVSPTVCQEKGFSYSQEKQQNAYDEWLGIVVSKYKNARTVNGYSAEELAEMRAEFGAGTRIMDCLTGEKFVL